MSNLFDIYKKIDGIMDIISKIVDQALEVEDENHEVDEILINTFTRFRHNFKEYKGTAGGFTGFSEYIYIFYIRKYLEKKLEITFLRIEERGINYFRADLNQIKIFLAPGIKVRHYLNIKISSLKNGMEPDCFIAIEKNGKIIPIAIIEIKLQIGPADFKEQILERFKNEIKPTLEEQGIKLPYFICLFLGSRPSTKTNKEGKTMDDYISEFLSMTDKCRIMRKVRNLNDWDPIKKAFIGYFKGKSTVSILDDVISEIKSFKNE